MALNTSSDFNKFLALDTPIACDASNKDLIDILLSPSTVIFFLKFLIFSFITKYLVLIKIN